MIAYAIKSKEGRYWQKGTAGNPMWVRELSLLCLHSSTAEAERTLDYIRMRPEFFQAPSEGTNTEPTIVPVTITEG